MNEKELFELAKKFGDNYTYGQIVNVLKEKFILKKRVQEGINFILDNGRFVENRRKFMKQVKEELENEFEL